MGTAGRVVLWMVLLVGTVEGGLPECASDRFQCHYTNVNPAFGDAFTLMFHGITHLIKESDRMYSALCNRDNWYRKETACNADCPLNFEITYPEHRRISACAYDNSFQPFVASAHLDMQHPYNGKEFDLVVHGSPGNPDRMGCDPKSFEGKNYTGKIVVVERGACAFSTKFRNLATTGAAMGLMINTAISNTLDLAIFPMGGSSGGFENLPAMMVATHYRELITEPYDNGEALKGKFTLGCSDSTGFVDDPEYVMDNCPYFLLTRGLCDPMKNDEDRLCSRCPVELSIPGVGETACIWGNGLFPRRAKNNIFTAFSFPTTESIVYLDLSNGTGCTLEEYLPHKGRIVALFLPSECLVYTAMRRANEAGVKAFLLVQPPSNFYPTFVEGTSHGVTIPVGTITPWNATKFMDYMKTQTAIKGGFDSPPNAFTFRLGVMPPQWRNYTPSPTFAPVRLVAEDDKAVVEGTPAVIVSVLFIAVILVAILVRALTQQEMVLRRANHFTVPLGVASTGLSLTLLTTITIIAFVLSQQAGQQAVDTVVQSGHQAVETMHENTLENLADLSFKLVSTVASGTVQMLVETLDDARDSAMIQRRIFQSSDGSWEWFVAHFKDNVEIQKQLKWNVRVQTVEGFYMDEHQRTDSRPDDQRNDGLKGVSETQNGHLYGWQTFSYNQRVWTADPDGVIGRGWYDPFKFIGNFYGDPMEAVKEMPDYTQTWVVNEYNLPIPFRGSHTAPIVMLTPMTNASRIFTGVVTAELDVGELAGNIIKEHVSAHMENLTVFLVNDRGIIISSTAGASYRKFDTFSLGNDFSYATKLYTALETKHPQVNAAYNYINAHYTSLSLSGRGVFDQREYYSGYSNLLMHFPFERSVADVSGNKWRAEVRGRACGPNCYGAGREGSGLVFTGDTVLHIYSNLTTDVPRVAATRNGTGAWMSSFPVYNETGTLPDGSEAVFWEGRAMLREPFHFREDVTMSVWLMHAGRVDMTPSDSSGQIYSDTVSGDAALRWYANGMIFVSRINYGCRTNPVTSLTPGEWTHLTAVVNWEEEYCAVYVNGVLHDKMQMSVSINIGFSGGVHLIGQNFQGTMDDFQVYNRSLTPSEIRTLHETGDTGKVDSRQWYMEFGMEDSGAGARGGIRAVAMIPVEDIQRNVEYNNEVTMRNLGVEEDNTQKDLDQITADNIFILVMVALICMFIFLMFNGMITAPFTSFARLMTNVAVMNVEAVRETKYVIRELSAMDHAMVLMARNLKEYKSFIPQSIIMENVEDSEDDELSRADSSTNRVQTYSSPSKRSYSSSGKGKKSSASSASKESLIAGAARMMTVGLTRKKITIVISNIVGFHKMTDKLNEQELINTHSSVLSIVLAAADRGNPAQFNGDHMSISFNTTKPAASHRHLGCHFLHAVQSETSNLSPPVSMTFSCVSGEAKVGVMGNDTMKQYSIVGALVPWAHALERFCRHLELPNLVDPVVAESAKNNFVLYHADIVSYPKRFDKPHIRVSTLAKQIDVSADEWMYQLEEAMKKDPYGIWNEIFLNILDQHFKTAKEKLSEIPNNLVPEKVMEKVTRQLEAEELDPTLLI